MAVDPSQRYKSRAKWNPVAGFDENRKKRQQLEDSMAAAQSIKSQASDQAKKDQSKPGKNIFEKIASGTGNFVKSMATDVKNTTVDTWQELGDVGRGILASNDMNRKTALAEQRRQQSPFGAGTDANWADPNWVAKKKAYDAETKKLTTVSDNTTQDAAKLQKVNAKKAGFDSAESFLNFGTLGLEGLVKAPIKQVIKTGGKDLLRQIVMHGGPDAVEQFIRTRGDQFAKDAATHALAQEAKQTAKTGIKDTAVKIAMKSAPDAALGAGYGVTSTGNNPDAHLHDYLLNAAFGAGIGSIIPHAGTALKTAGGKVVKLLQPKEGAIHIAGPSHGADHADVNTILNKAVEEQSGKYGNTLFTRVKNAIGDSVDPFRALAKIDRKYAASQGIKHSQLNADQSLEDLARRSAASEREAAGLFEKKHQVVDQQTGQVVEQSAKDLVQKYGGDSSAGKEFNNYTNAKFDLEFRQKHPGQRIINGLDDHHLQEFIQNYEAKNPSALTDLATKKKINDMAIDYAAKSGALSAEDAARIKGSYQNAVPLERVFPNDLQRPQIMGRNLGSIAKQTVAQRLEGNSDIPLSNSFDTMLNRVYKAVSQGNRAKLAQKLLERTHEGHIDANILVGAGNKAARLDARAQIQEINKGVRYLKKRISVSGRQARRLASELNKLNKAGLNESLAKEADPSLAGKLVDPGIKTTPAETKNIVASLLREPTSKIRAIQSKIATREPKLAMKLDEIINYQSKIEANKAAKLDMKNVIAELGDDPTTGKQVISGLLDGQPYKMEVPPDLAKAVMGLDQQKLPGVLKALAIAKKPFEVAWTGILNPVFAGISFAFYDTPMSVINSPQGFKTLGPKAVLESFKSLKSSSEFQQRLAQDGARPYGGSGASSFVKPDAASMAAQRNILTNIAHHFKNPEKALSALDIWGGKLANMTRTRVARAAYDDAIKKGANESEAMANATLAYRTIMPDFDTMSNLTRQINSVVPFYAASVAGTRSLGKALARDPAGTSAKFLAMGILPTVGITAFSLMQPDGQEFYKDMEASGNTMTLDNNLIIVLPGANKDEKTGKWNGIVKIPLAPEFRALNQTTWRETRAAMGGDGPSGSHVALSIFDAITGGVRTGENPLITTQKILAGQDPMTGKRIINGSMADLPTSEQKYSTTSAAGTAVGNLLHTSPIQGDKILGQFGIAGKTAQNGGRPVQAVTDTVSNRFAGARSETQQSAFYDAYGTAKAKRDKASKEVTDLLTQGKINEAKRKANEYNASIPKYFAAYMQHHPEAAGYNKEWDPLLTQLPIKTTDTAFNARLKKYSVN